MIRLPGEVRNSKFIRLSGQIEPQRWRALKERGGKAGLTPSALLCAAFAEVLSQFSMSPRFTINMTTFNRWQAHPQMNRLIGDFTATNLLEVDFVQERFEERARRLQDRLWQDLEHRAFNGVRVLRELKKYHGNVAQAAMPVVFTSTLIGNEDEAGGAPQPFQGKRIYSVSQTPQVTLDHQITEQGGTLYMTWDFIEDVFPEGLIAEMFATYGAFLDSLIDEEETWHE
jgi:non-ribosomal peptide synthetase component F